MPTYLNGRVYKRGLEKDRDSNPIFDISEKIWCGFDSRRGQTYLFSPSTMVVQFAVNEEVTGSSPVERAKQVYPSG